VRQGTWQALPLAHLRSAHARHSRGIAATHADHLQVAAVGRTAAATPSTPWRARWRAAAERRGFLTCVQPLRLPQVIRLGSGCARPRRARGQSGLARGRDPVPHQQSTVALSERIALVLGGHTHSPSDVQSCYASARTHSNIHTLACGVGGEADDRMCTARLADATSTRGHGHRGRARHARWMTCATRWSESRLVARHVVCPPTVLTKHG